MATQFNYNIYSKTIPKLFILFLFVDVSSLEQDSSSGLDIQRREKKVYDKYGEGPFP